MITLKDIIFYVIELMARTAITVVVFYNFKHNILIGILMGAWIFKYIYIMNKNFVFLREG